MNGETALDAVTCVVCDADVPLPTSVRYRKDGFEIARCRFCGLLFRTSLPTPGELGRIYGPEYFVSAQGDTGGQGYDDYVGEADLHRGVARERLSLLARYVDPGKLLDVGAAAGFFVSEAQAAGWEAHGIDIAREIVEWGQTHLAAPLSVRTLHEQTEDHGGAFDAVTMWDYIEHAVDPAGDLERAYRLLEPGGILSLSTGDAGSVVARLSGARWHLLTPRHHNYFFPASSLALLLRRCGFDVVFAKHLSTRYSARYLAYKLRTMFDAAPVRIIADAMKSSSFGSRTVPVNLGDILTIVARRP